MSLLTICQDAARELSIAVPSSIVAATSDADAMLLLRLAKKEGFELARRAQWSALRKEHTFTTVAADSQTSSIPSDYSFMCQETFFDRTSRREVFGPITPSQWQQYKTNLSVPSDPHWIRRGATLLMSPLQAAGHSLYYEYISTKWARSAGAAEQTTWLADTDTHIWSDDNILTLGVIWRWRKHKSLSFQDEQEEYERVVVDEIMRDGGKPILDTRIVTGGGVPRGKAGMQSYNTIPIP